MAEPRIIYLRMEKQNIDRGLVLQNTCVIVIGSRAVVTDFVMALDMSQHSPVDHLC
jgi:hypothetical protein